MVSATCQRKLMCKITHHCILFLRPLSYLYAFFVHSVLFRLTALTEFYALITAWFGWRLPYAVAFSFVLVYYLWQDEIAMALCVYGEYYKIFNCSRHGMRHENDRERNS